MKEIFLHTKMENIKEIVKKIFLCYKNLALFLIKSKLKEIFQKKFMEFLENTCNCYVNVVQ